MPLNPNLKAELQCGEAIPHSRSGPKRRQILDGPKPPKNPQVTDTKQLKRRQKACPKNRSIKMSLLIGPLLQSIFERFPQLSRILEKQTIANSALIETNMPSN